MELPEYEDYPYPGDTLKVGSYILLDGEGILVDIIWAKAVLLEQIRESAAVWRMLSMPTWVVVEKGDDPVTRTPAYAYRYYANKKMDTGEGINWHAGHALDMSLWKEHLNDFIGWGKHDKRIQ